MTRASGRHSICVQCGIVCQNRADYDEKHMALHQKYRRQYGCARPGEYVCHVHNLILDSRMSGHLHHAAHPLAKCVLDEDGTMLDKNDQPLDPNLHPNEQGQAKLVYCLANKQTPLLLRSGRIEHMHKRIKRRQKENRQGLPRSSSYTYPVFVMWYHVLFAKVDKNNPVSRKYKCMACTDDETTTTIKTPYHLIEMEMHALSHNFAGSGEFPEDLKVLVVRGETPDKFDHPVWYRNMLKKRFWDLCQRYEVPFRPANTYIFPFWKQYYYSSAGNKTIASRDVTLGLNEDRITPDHSNVRVGRRNGALGAYGIVYDTQWIRDDPRSAEAALVPAQFGRQLEYDDSDMENIDRLRFKIGKEPHEAYSCQYCRQTLPPIPKLIESHLQAHRDFLERKNDLKPTDLYCDFHRTLLSARQLNSHIDLHVNGRREPDNRTLPNSYMVGPIDVLVDRGAWRWNRLDDKTKRWFKQTFRALCLKLGRSKYIGKKHPVNRWVLYLDKTRLKFCYRHAFSKQIITLDKHGYIAFRHPRLVRLWKEHARSQTDAERVHRYAQRALRARRASSRREGRERNLMAQQDRPSTSRQRRQPRNNDSVDSRDWDDLKKDGPPGKPRKTDFDDMDWDSFDLPSLDFEPSPEEHGPMTNLWEDVPLDDEDLYTMIYRPISEQEERQLLEEVADMDFDGGEPTDYNFTNYTRDLGPSDIPDPRSDNSIEDMVRQMDF